MIDKQLKENIIAWAKERELLKQENMLPQFLKICEEVSEFIEANKLDDELDAIGDIIVTLIIFIHQSNQEIIIDEDLLNKYKSYPSITNFSYIALIGRELIRKDLEEAGKKALRFLTYVYASYGQGFCNECLGIAYNEIKDRKGKTINGNFVKEK